MKNRLSFLVFAILLLLSNSACNLFFPSAPEGAVEDTPISEDLAQQWQEDINQLRAWQANLPGYANIMDGQLPNPKPDIMEVFTILDHLSVQEGWQLDYGYCADGLGSFPVLYARQTNTEPLKDQQACEYVRKKIEIARDDISSDYLQYITSDGSPLGYLQIVQLEIMGNQFYLGWHANYNDLTPLATRAAIEALIEDINSKNFGTPFTMGEIHSARRLNVEPEVEINANNVLLRFVTFTKWGGFEEQAVTLSLTEPFKITYAKPKQLLPYSCDVMF